MCSNVFEDFQNVAKGNREPKIHIEFHFRQISKFQSKKN